VLVSSRRTSFPSFLRDNMLARSAVTLDVARPTRVDLCDVLLCRTSLRVRLWHDYKSSARFLESRLSFYSSAPHIPARIYTAHAHPHSLTPGTCTRTTPRTTTVTRHPSTIATRRGSGTRAWIQMCLNQAISTPMIVSVMPWCA
jgi:hypothetical protein